MPDSPPRDDPDDYELEDADTSVDALRTQRTREDIVRAAEALEIDEAQRAMEERHMLDPEDLNFKFRFQVKHLLVATTVLSIVLALGQLLDANVIAMLLVLGMLGLIAANAYLAWEERKRFNAASERRSAAIRRIRERQAAQLAGDAPSMYDEQLEEEVQQADEEFAEAVEDERFRLSFSMRDLLTAFTVAAVVIGLSTLFGVKALALLLGLLAVAGLTAFGIGLKPPPAVVTVWWVTMALYILLSLARAVGLIGGG
ncbi:MAG: hypothetical protein KDA37_08135 [Planctomycetales bacterium]|nr:hypothetical protein [Planctomycetales bacterium]